MTQMKRVFVLLFALISVLTASAYTSDSWEKIDEKSVNNRHETDVFNVNSSKSYSKLKFKINGGDVLFERIVINYKSGRSQTIHLRSEVKAGTESREIDLSGSKRRIDSVEVTYQGEGKEKSNGKGNGKGKDKGKGNSDGGGKKASVELWGR